MHARFILEYTIRSYTQGLMPCVAPVKQEGHLKSNVSISPMIVLVLMEQFGGETLLCAELLVHVVEHTGEVLRIISAGTGENRNNCLPFVVLAHPLKLLF